MILDIDNDEEIFLSTSFPSIIPLVLGLMITRDIGGRSQIFFFLLWHSSSFSHLKSLATFLFYQRKSQFFSLTLTCIVVWIIIENKFSHS